MAVYFGGGEIWSDVTDHKAQLATDGWEVSWPPGRSSLSFDSALHAMILVDIYVRDPPPWDDEWLYAAGLEKEIGVTRRADWHG